MNKDVLWLTRTAAFTALLVAAQLATAALGNKIVTGSVVNMILIVAVSLCGLKTGLTVAAVSNVFAKIIGIGPFWTLIPFVALGNMALVAVWFFSDGLKLKNDFLKNAAVIAVSSLVKFLVLYLGAVKFAVPVLLKLPAPAAAAVSSVFSFQQILTASIGGVLAAASLPVIKKAVVKKN